MQNKQSERKVSAIKKTSLFLGDDSAQYPPGDINLSFSHSLKP